MESNKQITIAFFGDSFSYNNDGYPGQISSHFKGIHENYSTPASSPLHTYQQLQHRFSKDKKAPNVAIITLTHSDRLFHDRYLIRGSGAVDKEFNSAPQQFNDAVSTYYAELFSKEGSALMHRMYCSALAQFSLDHSSTKFIFLPCFDSFTGSVVGNYVVTGPRIMNFAEHDLEIHKKEFNGAHLRNNHLNEKFNKTLASIIIREIENYKYNTAKHVDILGEMLS